MGWPAAAFAQAAPECRNEGIPPEFRNEKIVILGRSRSIVLREGPSDGREPARDDAKCDDGYWLTTSSQVEGPGGKVYKPMSPQRDQVRQRMVKRRVLEEFAAFLSPLRLPQTLYLFASDCDGGAWDSPHYDPAAHAINMCYSFSAEAERRFADMIESRRNEKWWTPAPLEQLMAGMYVGVLLHEAGHALFDLMNVPVFGRQEDAADQIAAFIGLQFGKDNARTIIKGFANYWGYGAFVLKSDPGRVLGAPGDVNYRDCRKDAFCRYYDVHGTASQRYYNTLCLAYADEHRDNFKDFVEAGLLPEDRARNCNREYKQAELAFKKTLLPFIDPVQRDKVMRRAWFTGKELTDR